MILNPDKCSFSKESVRYLGHKISSRGITADPETVQIVDFQMPKSKQEVRSFLGMCNQMGKFCIELAKVSKPLHNLQRKILLFSGMLS